LFDVRARCEGWTARGSYEVHRLVKSRFDSMKQA
jgi:hypothetical protein